MSDRVHALAFNALTEALGDADVFVRLSAREATTTAVVTAVRNELADQLAAGLQRLREDGETDMRQAIAVADSIARGEDQ